MQLHLLRIMSGESSFICFDSELCTSACTFEVQFLDIDSENWIFYDKLDSSAKRSKLKWMSIQQDKNIHLFLNSQSAEQICKRLFLLSEQDKLRKLPHYKLFGRISHASSAKDGQTASNIYINIYHFQSLVFQYICTRFCVCIYTRAEKKKQEEVSNFAKYIKLQDSSKFVLI